MSEDNQDDIQVEKWSSKHTPARSDVEYIPTMRKRPALTQDLMRTMGFPDKIFGALKDKVPKIVQAIAFKKFNNYLESEKKKELSKSACLLVISGQPKIGKSNFLSVVGKYSKINPIYTVKSCYYINMVDLRQNIQNKNNFDGNTTYIDKCNLVDVLLLDDLGKEPKGGYFPEQLSFILRKRFADNKPTFICTELSREKIKEYYKDLPPLVEILNKFDFIDFEKGVVR